MSVILPTEGDLTIGKVHDPVIGDRDSMRIAGQIFKNRFWLLEKRAGLMPARKARRRIYSLLGSAKLNGIDPEAYMTETAAPHRCRCRVSRADACRRRRSFRWPIEPHQCVTEQKSQNRGKNPGAKLRGFGTGIKSNRQNRSEIPRMRDSRRETARAASRDPGRWWSFFSRYRWLCCECEFPLQRLPRRWNRLPSR